MKARSLTSQVTEMSKELEFLVRLRIWWGGSDKVARSD